MSFKFDNEHVCGDMEGLIYKLKKQEVVCVAGCGNDARNQDPGYPARFSNVLSVGAADYDGYKCKSSTEPHQETDIDVYALGENVIAAQTSESYINQKVQLADPQVSQTHPLSPLPPPPAGPPPPPVFKDGDLGKHEAKKGTFDTVAGTSFATPAVCGLIAIILQCARKQDEADEADKKYERKLADIVTNINKLRKLISRYLFNENESGSLKKLLQQQKVEEFFQEIIEKKRLEELRSL